MTKIPLLFLVGPTASGKTRLALELSTRLNGEIVSMDSMQIYRTLEIGTAKPTRDEQNAARHHLIDIKNPQETYSAAQWADDARAAISDILARGKTPIVVGGTGFYARALLQPETLASAPPNAELRAQLEIELQQNGAEFLHQKLQTLDENAAQRLNFADTRRVMRAIEIALYETEIAYHKPEFRNAENSANRVLETELLAKNAVSETQNLISENANAFAGFADSARENRVLETPNASAKTSNFGAQSSAHENENSPISTEDSSHFKAPNFHEETLENSLSGATNRVLETANSRENSANSPEFAPLIFGLNWPRAELYQRIEKRIDAMLHAGFMDELRYLETLNLPHDATAAQSLGYKQMRAALDDETQFSDALELWKRDTRRYAKRQMTWFRHQLPTRWLEVSDDTNWSQIADFIAQQFEIEYSKSCGDAPKS